MSSSFRDGAYVASIGALLAVGILGVLLLNTAMQTQADRIAVVKQRLASLALQAQIVQTDLDRQDSPSALAAHAVALHLRPAPRLLMLTVSARTPTRLPAPPRVSAHARAKSPIRGG